MWVWVCGAEVLYEGADRSSVWFESFDSAPEVMSVHVYKVNVDCHEDVGT